MSTYEFTITRTGGIDQAGTVDWAVTGSGTDAADAADFVGGVLPSGTASFAAGETAKVIQIEVAEDADLEPDEGFTVTLSNASSNHSIDVASASSTIVNDDVGGGADYGSHRYWRLFVTANGGDAGVTDLHKLEFRSTAGGADLTGSGTPMSGGSGSDIVGAGATNAFDASLTSTWGRTSATNVWIGYDFGAAVSVAELAMFCGNASYTRRPHTFSLDYSDDGTAWTTAEAFTAQGWNSQVWDAYPKAELGTNEARMWRVYIPTVDSGTATICTELEWRATAGGADQSPLMAANDAGASGRAIYNSQGSGTDAFRAYDGVLGANGWNGGTAPAWLGFVFPAPVTVAEVAFTFWHQDYRWNPTEIQIQYSNDNGASWTTVATYSGLTSTASEQKLFAV